MSAPRADKAVRLAQGVQKLLLDMGYDSLTEVKLRIRRRVDVMGIDEKGRIIIVEVKSGPAYRVAEKSREYLDFCDEFYFAVDADFPQGLIPAENGLIVADSFGGVILRPSSDFNLNAARRRNVTLRFGKAPHQ